MTSDQALVCKYFLNDFEKVTFETALAAAEARLALAMVLDIHTEAYQLKEEDVIEGFDYIVGQWVLRVPNKWRLNHARH